MIDYRVGGEQISVEQMIALYQGSTLADRRPADDRSRMARMLAGANLVITAWDGELPVGIARSLTDWVYCTYLSGLAVNVSHQKRGIGRELMRRTQAAAPQACLLLPAAPAAEPYYPRVGFTHHPQAWILRPGERIE